MATVASSDWAPAKGNDMEMRIALLVALFSLPSEAQNPNESEESASKTTLSEVVVTGEFPGPGLWKVTSQADDGTHVLWILGAPGPIPKTISWRARDVERVIAESQEIIGNTSLGITFADKVGIFKALLMAPSLLMARHNPDDRRLQDVVPADVYSRWLVQKTKYLGRDSTVEKWRPTFAADKLKNEAQKALIDTLSYPTWGVIYRIAKENKIKITSPGLIIKIPKEKIKPAIKQFLNTQLQDVDCFAATIAMVEALGDTDAIRARGIAWAIGDIAALRELPEFPNPQPQCESALLNLQVLKDLELGTTDDLPAKLEQLWLDAVEKALAANRSSFTVLPIAELFNPSGRLATLRANGYLIEEPQQID